MTLVRKTAAGLVEGFEKETVSCWFGIPFAKPPVGELRFKRAQAPDAWEGVKECKKMGPRPHDFLAGGMDENEIRTNEPSEDCLYLNVWAPKDAQAGDKKPVFVWIYGGANHTGEASNPLYDLTSFAEKDIVSVSFNYRLGPLGFYNFHLYDESFDSNCAVSDMVRAMQWVQENIAEFGGDPEQVTVCGESAGGMSVYALLTAPPAKGTFKRAIPMSGIADNMDYPKVHRLNNELYFKSLGITEAEVGKLKEMTPDELRKGVAGVFANTDVYPGIEMTGPCMDGDLLPCKPWESVAKGERSDVELLVGSCRDEATLFYPMRMIPMNWDQVKEMLEFSGRGDKFDEFKKVYGDLPEPAAMVCIGTDRIFWADSIRVTDAQAAFNTVYRYRFDFVTPNAAKLGLGATHSSDIGPVLNTTGNGQMLFDEGLPEEDFKKIREMMHTAVVNFVKTGNPGPMLGCEWKPYTAEKRETMLVDIDHCEMADDPCGERFKVWEDLFLFAD